MENKTTIILVALIIIIGILIAKMCTTSKFAANKESISIIPSISDDSVLIFYAPWCGHCKAAKSEFEKAVEMGQGKIVLVDATQKENESLVKNYDVKGFPTIIKGDKTMYRGARTSASISKFMSQK